MQIDVQTQSLLVDENTSYKRSYKDLCHTQPDLDIQTQKTKWINEAGMFTLILSSKRPNADRFRQWVVEEVLPQLRQNGKIPSHVWQNIAQDDLIVKERHVRDLVAETLEESITEKHIPNIGYIDILTPTELIEVKNMKNWKSALGQLIVYGTFYPSHQLVMLLYGKIAPANIADIRGICDLQKVEVRIYLL